MRAARWLAGAAAAVGLVVLVGSSRVALGEGSRRWMCTRMGRFVRVAGKRTVCFGDIGVLLEVTEMVRKRARGELSNYCPVERER